MEAQGWIINDRGMVELVAHKTDINGSPPQPKDGKVCQRSAGGRTGHMNAGAKPLLVAPFSGGRKLEGASHPDQLLSVH